MHHLHNYFWQDYGAAKYAGDSTDAANYRVNEAWCSGTSRAEAETRLRRARFNCSLNHDIDRRYFNRDLHRLCALQTVRLE